MVSRINYDILKSFMGGAAKEKRQTPRTDTGTAVLKSASHKRWSLKPNTDPTSSLPTFTWTKNRNT